MEEEAIVERAVSRFREGYLCSESILLTFAEAFGIKCWQIPKIATGFGGGIGRAGCVCGALTGAIMALGLKYGRRTLNETEAYEKCLKKSLELYKKFEEEFGSVFCRDLTQCNLTTTEGRQKFKEQQIRETKCTKYVETSMRALLNMIDK
ncbi:C_GCAxxG_C_C family protein [Candidatus Bathyarchaeota archaeon]|nr:C_GCAxxG_C_C family protein [Candidatus Bathyarchaeota archaeon]